MTNNPFSPFEHLKISDIELIQDKLLDAQTPGFLVECTPEQADSAGAFVEDALSLNEALESQMDVDLEFGE